MAPQEKNEKQSNKFQNLNKTTLLQEVRYFHSNKVNPSKCILILTKMLYLIHQGEDNLTVQEATSIFFATTKLFQSKDLVVRRLVYLCIKALSSLAQDVIIVTSSLTKDMSGKEDLCRAPAIRTLCSITDITMLQGIERYLKQAIVDKNPAISSAALVSALHLSAAVPELIRRWVNEAQEALLSENIMVPYHALAFIFSARNNDRISRIKLVTKLTKTPLRSPYALSLVIRHAAKLAEEDLEASELYMEFIEACMRHKSDIVVYEATHAIVNLGKSTKYLSQAISILQIFCCSSKAATRLAGVRTLAKLTIKYPNAVVACTADLENLISDANRSVATLAVTTLLATGKESSVDKLMKQISGFLSEISDEFKIIVVHAIRGLYSKYPRKYQLLASFLASMLRDKGSIQYKTAIADAIINLIEENPNARETGLAHLCEFIEDCEYSYLAIKILDVIGKEGPKASQPSRYIRYIYNRLLLESSPVRAAAVSTVARFGASCPDLLPNVRVLLSRCHTDEDDEVRDRAICYYAILNSESSICLNDYIINLPILNPVRLEKALYNHLQSDDSDQPFNLAVALDAEKTHESKKEIVENESKHIDIGALKEIYVKQLKAIPGIEKFGVPFKTCSPVELTEPETEYRVRCIKHIFPQHLILQFECLNTLNDQFLKNVHIRLECIEGYKLLGEYSCNELYFNKQGNIFCFLEFPVNPMETLGTLTPTLEFNVRDYDPISGLMLPGQGYDDTYPLEEVEINVTDQFLFSNSNEWETIWDNAAGGSEACDTFVIAASNLDIAALSVCEHLHLPKSAIDGDAVKAIYGCGTWREGTPIVFKAKLAAVQGAVTMQLTTRSEREDIATILLVAVG